jgi:hypothetical protein
MLFVLTTRCFTDWVPDTEARQYIVYVQIVGVLVFLLLMLLETLWKVQAKLNLVVNLIAKI